jgi:acetylornithine/succinyldiaminopimelate/putrescine aminotransferase
MGKFRFARKAFAAVQHGSTHGGDISATDVANIAMKSKG